MDVGVGDQHAVRAAQRIVGSEGLVHAGQKAREPGIVGVQLGDQVAAGKIERDIAGGGWALGLAPAVVDASLRAKLP